MDKKLVISKDVQENLTQANLEKFVSLYRKKYSAPAKTKFLAYTVGVFGLHHLYMKSFAKFSLYMLFNLVNLFIVIKFFLKNYDYVLNYLLPPFTNENITEAILKELKTGEVYFLIFFGVQLLIYIEEIINIKKIIYYKNLTEEKKCLEIVLNRELKIIEKSNNKGSSINLSLKR